MDGTNPRDTLNPELLADIESVSDFLQYGAECYWRECLNRSRLLFWRRKSYIITMNFNGIPVCWLPGKQTNNHIYKPIIIEKTVKKAMSARIN